MFTLSHKNRSLDQDVEFCDACSRVISTADRSQMLMEQTLLRATTGLATR